jgi:hypothetical protein
MLEAGTVTDSMADPEEVSRVMVRGLSPPDRLSLSEALSTVLSPPETVKCSRAIWSVPEMVAYLSIIAS